MAIGTGTAAIAAFKKSSVWGTPVNTNVANAGLYILGDTLPTGVPEYVQDESLGSAWESTGDSGNLDVTGDINLDLRYDSLNTILALCFGAAAAPAQQSTTLAYNHVLTLTDTLDGLFGTYCVYDGVAIRECPSLKFNGFELSSAAGQPVKLRLMATASDRLVTGQLGSPGGAHTTSALGGVTYIPIQHRAMFDDIKIRINSQSGSALADGDSFYASAWTLTFTRPQVYAHVTNLLPGVTEGVADGKPSISLALTEDRYVDVTRITECRTKVPKKVDITMSGPLAAAGYPYKILLEMPQLLYEDTRYPFSGAGKIVPDLVLRGQRANTAPSGMTGLVLPLRATLCNIQNTNALA